MKAIVSLGWRQAWRSASLDSVFSVLLAILFATLTVSLGQQQPVSGVLLVAAGVLVTTNLIKQLLLMQGMFVLGKFRLYWATVQNYVDWCRIGLSYSVLGLSYAQWAAPSAELSVLLAVAVLFRWADVVTSFRGYQWVGEKVLPIERALMSSRMFAGIVWVACCAFTNAYIALRLSGSDRLFDSFFVIYRLGFLSDLEHSVWNGGSQDPQKDLAAALGIVTALIMTVVMMNIFIGVLSESYSQAYRNRHLSFQRERARIAFAHSVRNRAYDAWRSTCCCRRQKDAASSKYLWYSVKRTQAQGSHQHPPKQRSSSAGKSRRMSTLVRGLMLNKTMGSEDSGRRPRLPRQPSGGHSAHLPPPLAKPAFQAVVPAPPSQSEDEGDIPGMVLEDDVPVWEKIVSEGLDA
ncbi:unnamed protein product [Effrenium voratum]|uniref:Ion transport domain-containing protein n=1 Tax=Effrenium voratum TaxID=2562239 RepID=A0AA36NBH0_9DINO|nr:unnamed protein product [Effrenium voratum]